MIGFDTNILVRYIVRDDLKQARASTRLIEKQCTADDPGIISQVVLCELYWVLSRGYGYDRESIAGVLDGVLTSLELRVESAEVAWQALRYFERGKGDFADYLIAFANRANLAETTYTFDRKAADGTLLRLIP